MAVVLVAEQNPAVRDLVSRRLTAWGHAVMPVADGAAALNALRDHEVDLAMIDTTLPRRSGLEVLGHIRSDERLRDLPVVVMTAGRAVADIGHAYLYGADECLAKPVTLRTLAEVVSTLPRRCAAQLDRVPA